MNKEVRYICMFCRSVVKTWKVEEIEAFDINTVGSCCKSKVPNHLQHLVD